MRLAIVTSHPIQYYAPLFRCLSEQIDLHVFFCDSVDARRQSAGFGGAFSWDIDLTRGYSNSTLTNVARHPDVESFLGCDTPEIAQRLEEGRFDVLLTLGWHLKSLLQAVWAAKRLGIKVCVRGDSQLTTPRSPVKRLIKRLAYPSLLRSFDAALYVGRLNRDYYLHYGFPERLLFHAPHAVDTDRFAQFATPEARRRLRESLNVAPGTRLVLFAGKLIALKRPSDLISAVHLLRERGINSEAMIAGSGPLTEELNALASASGVPLHNLGFRNQTEMPPAYAAADALVLPSAHETWGLVCNEALACGTPVVMSDAVGCAPDLGMDGQVGRTFRVADPHHCADVLADLFASPPPPTAIKAISDGFSLDRAASGIIEAVHFLSRKPADRREAIAGAR